MSESLPSNGHGNTPDPEAEVDHHKGTPVAVLDEMSNELDVARKGSRTGDPGNLHEVCLRIGSHPLGKDRESRLLVGELGPLCDTFALGWLLLGGNRGKEADN